MVEHLSSEQKVAGSSPAGSNFLLLSFRCNGMAKQHLLTFAYTITITLLVGDWNNHRFYYSYYSYACVNVLLTEDDIYL